MWSVGNVDRSVLSLTFTTQKLHLYPIGQSHVISRNTYHSQHAYQVLAKRPGSRAALGGSYIKYNSKSVA